MLRKFLGPHFDTEHSALVVRGYAEKEGDVWVAVCLEFCLAVQGRSMDEVRGKLQSQIDDYVHDAARGKNRKHLGVLMARRAPLSSYVRYYWIKWTIRLNQIGNGIAKTFKANVRYEPSKSCHV